MSSDGIFHPSAALSLNSPAQSELHGMVTRLVHVSDLHFPPRHPGQPEALAKSIVDPAPDIVAVTGDLTRNGTRAEFAAAAEFFARLPLRKLVVPGNHDIPVFNPLLRLLAPFSRFDRTFGNPYSPMLETPDVLVVGMNTAYGMRLGLDWSLGRVSPRRLARTVETLRSRKAGRLAIVACHHPLCPNPSDGQRSKTSGGPAAFEALAQAGMDILLHGHLHRAATRRHTVGGRAVFEICANTALSDRERGGGSGYNVITVDQGKWQLVTTGWQGGLYDANPLNPDDSGSIVIDNARISTRL